MITDEQIILVLKTFHQHSNPNDTIAMGKALEAYEQSKWVKFVVDDKSTFPPLDIYGDVESVIVATSKQAAARFNHKSYEWVTEDGCFVEERVGYDDVYWQPLPIFKE